MSGRVRPAWQRRAELSQHFLRGDSARRLVRIASIPDSDLVIEIGPGRGALTKVLAGRSGPVIAVELDAHLADELRARCPGRVDVVAADFLDFELPRGRYTVIGNIPYARSMDIVRKLADAANPPEDAWLVVQRELANRLCGMPFSRESRVSLELKPFWHLEIAHRLAKTEFVPPPSVESVFLRLSRRTRPLVDSDDAARYRALIALGFCGRPTLRQALRPRLTKVELRRLAVDFCFGADDGPADLLFEQWLGIFRFLGRLDRAR